MKKILFIINSLRVGGAEHMLLNILQKIDYKQYDVSLVYFITDGVYSSEIPPQVKTINPFKCGSRINNLFYGILKRLGLIKKWYKYKVLSAIDYYDAVVSYLEGFPVLIHSLVTERGKTNISFIHTDLEAFPVALYQFDSNHDCETTYNKMDQLVFVSQTAKDAFNRVFHSIAVKETVLPNFIDIESIKKKGSEYQVEKKGFSIVTIGRLATIKGFDLIPYIAAELKSRGKQVYFYIVGDGSERKHLEDLIRTLGVESCVIMAGFQRNPYPYLKMADLYISTSISEGMPLSICEAMVFGKPVVASRTAGSLSLIDDETGCIVDREVDGFVNTIMEIMEDSTHYKLMSDNAIRESKQFDFKPYMNSLYEMIG